MPKNYTVKEKNPKNINQPNIAILNSILNYSKALEVIKIKTKNIELILN